ncbi:MAG: TetR/AcrR family transcriptional regulator [Proteobacteria bacterium]|nr:TetR/AcrR family transcriptional regulator [Pseudomonadota bacterium]
MNIRTAIIDAAEARIRIAGFHGFSFREIAADVGVKSASVHYHFPTKADLGAATAARYLQLLLEQLGDAIDARPLAVKLDTIKAVFRNGLVRDGMMCLCGALGAEISSLPAPVALQTKTFFEECRTWLRRAFATNGNVDPDASAVQCLALLEGALLIARSLDDVVVFDQATLLAKTHG